MHAHEPPWFCLVLAGSHWERFGAEERIDGPYTATFRPAGFEHQCVIGPHGERFFSIELGAEWTHSLTELDSRATVGLTDLRDFHAFRALIQLHVEFCRQELDEFVMESLADELLGHSIVARASQERRRPPWLNRAIEYLEAHYMRPLRVEPLAHEVGVHRMHLARVFRQVYRCSMAEYLTAARVRRACTLLGERDLTLAQIALWVGFADQSHFTRAFTALVGQTPGAFRRSTFPDRHSVLDSNECSPTTSPRSHFG